MDKKKELHGGQKDQVPTYRVMHNFDCSREEGQRQGKARLVLGWGKQRHKQQAGLVSSWR